MRQVPEKPHYGIIGRGRAARHFQHYLRFLDIPFRSWARGGSVAELEDLFRLCNPILILISDSAIEEFIAAHSPLQGQKTPVHFSGCLSTPLAYGTHPLMTFSNSLYDLATYEKMPFILEKGRGPSNSPFPSRLNEVLPGLPNPYYFIPAGTKPFYHSLCVMSGNFTALLWKKLFTDFREKLGLPETVAYPYLEALCKNLQNPSASPLTGPLVRGDTLTLKRNLDSLEGDPYQAVYQAFVQAYQSSQSQKERDYPL